MSAPGGDSGSERPEWTRSAPAVEVDLREAFRSGRETLRPVLEAAAAARPGQAILVRAPFEPRPLYPVLDKRGFEHWTEQAAEDDWRAWFRRR